MKTPDQIKHLFNESNSISKEEYDNLSPKDFKLYHLNRILISLQTHLTIDDFKHMTVLDLTNVLNILSQSHWDGFDKYRN